MKVYMEITLDDLELPIAVADSVHALARICKTTEGAITSGMSKARKGKHRSRFVCVEVEDDGDGEENI